MTKPARLAYPRPALGALILCVLISLPLTLTAQEPAPWLQEMEERWWNALRGGDRETLRAMFAADAEIFDESQTTRGAEYAEGYVMALYATLRNDCGGRVDCACEWSTEGALVLDELATVISRGSCTATPRGGGEPRVRRLRFLKIWELQPDGAWLVVLASHEPSPPS